MESPDDQDPGLGAHLRHLRTESGQTLQEAADAIGISAPYLSQLERDAKQASSKVMHLLVAHYGDALLEVLDELPAPTDSTTRMLREHRGQRGQRTDFRSAAAVDAAQPDRGPVDAVREAAAAALLAITAGRPADQALVAALQQVHALLQRTDLATLTACLDLVADVIGRHGTDPARLRELLADHAEADERAGGLPVEAVRLARAISLEFGKDSDGRPVQVRTLLEQAARLLIATPAPISIKYVAFMPPGEVRFVWPRELARDEHGLLWVNPEAGSVPDLPTNAGVRVLREVDRSGTRVIACLMGLTDPLGTYDPDRHTTPVVERFHMPGESAPLQAYARTAVTIWLDPDPIRVVPAAAADTDPKDYPADADGAVHILSAANPHATRCSQHDNAEANQQLHTHLDEQGLRHVQAHTTPLDDQQAPTEDGAALLGVDRTRALAIAEQFGQTSIFEWTADHWAVIDLNGVTLSMGWTLSTPEPHEAPAS